MRRQIVCLCLTLVFAPLFIIESLAQAAEEIQLRSSTSLNGPLKGPGMASYLGTKLKFDQINAQGGIHGKKIHYSALDDSYKPEITLDNVKEFANDPKIIAVLNDFGTGNALALLPFLDKTGFPFLFPIGGGDRLRVPVRNNVFLLRAEYRNDSEAAMAYVVDKLHINEIGIFYQSDGMGDAFHTGLVGKLREHSLKPTVDEAYDRHSRDFKNAVEEFMRVRPKAIFLGANSDVSLPFVEALYDKDYAPLLIFSSTTAAMKILKSPIAKNQKSQILIAQTVPLVLLEDIPIARQFKKDMQAEKTDASELDSQSAFEGYIGASIVARALESISGEITRESLVKSLNALGKFDLGGIAVNLNSTRHTVFEEAHIYELKIGKVTELSK